MDGAKTADALLPTETAARLLRVFCFLRQHERKAKVARKMAELQAWTRSHCESQTASPTTDSSPVLGGPLLVPSTNQDVQALGEELDRMCAEAAGSFAASTPADSAPSISIGQLMSLESGPDAKHLHRELRELQRGVILSSADSSGLITAGDLASALRSLHRPTTKAEAQWMIWEVDDDLDGALTWDEFRAAYVRAARDRLALEPRQLYYVVLFLLCDADGSQSVSALELTTELRRLTKSERLAESLMAALRTDAEGQLMRRFSLAAFLRLMLADLPASFPLH